MKFYPTGDCCCHCFYLTHCCRLPLREGYRMYFNQHYERWSLHYGSKYIKGSIARLDTHGSHQGAWQGCGVYLLKACRGLRKFLLGKLGCFHAVQVLLTTSTASIRGIYQQYDLATCTSRRQLLVLFHAGLLQTQVGSAALQWQPPHCRPRFHLENLSTVCNCQLPPASCCFHAGRVLPLLSPAVSG